MQVSVKPYLFLKAALGSKELILELPDRSAVSDLLEILRNQYGLQDLIATEYGNLILIENDQPSGLVILVDGRNIKQLQGLDTLLTEGSVITLFPPAAGG
jgi:sulfur-carrier protein